MISCKAHLGTLWRMRYINNTLLLLLLLLLLLQTHSQTDTQKITPQGWSIKQNIQTSKLANQLLLSNL